MGNVLDGRVKSSKASLFGHLMSSLQPKSHQQVDPAQGSVLLQGELGSHHFHHPQCPLPPCVKASALAQQKLITTVCHCRH